MPFRSLSRKLRCTPLHIGHSRIPLMAMSYLGCVKTLVYRPIFRLFGTGAYAVREPALLIGAASVWLFFLLLRRIAGLRTACIGCCLLAVDSLYLLTTCFDWGPVALQHLLIVGGALLLMRFYQTLSRLSLAGGFFLLGLALWDKALAIWMLGGLAVALIVIFPRQVWAVTRLRLVLISVGALLLGALPLIVYNVHTSLATLRENTAWDTRDLAHKTHILVETARGGILLGYFNAEDRNTPTPKQPVGPMEKASAALANVDGDLSSGWMLYAFFAAVLLAPIGRPDGGSNRGVLFGRDDHRLDSDGAQPADGRQRASYDPFVAMARGGDRRFVRGRLPADGAIRRAGSGGGGRADRSILSAGNQ